MQFIILLLHILVCFSLIVLVLLQQGKGADIGAAFGSGASNTVFGSTGASSFLVKLTGGLALTFFLTSLFLGYLNQGAQARNAFQLPDAKTVVVPPSTDTGTNTKK